MKGVWLSFVLLGASAGGAILPLGCSSSSGGDAPKPTFTADQLRDPTQCKSCHATHYADWSRSMHAYASEDPVFLAMNARGQRETGGKLGTFCVQCHAPVAVNDKKTTDGLNLAQLPPAEKGVTCFFCHSIDSVGQSHVNADVALANDLVIRGEIKDAQANTAHASAYSALQDDQQPDSAQMCGSCHDIVSPAGGHIERTFAEWSGSIFASSHTTCAFNGNCHMASTPDYQVALNGPLRTLHSHDFAAVDVAVDPSFPTASIGAIPNVEALLANTLQGALCVNVLGGVRVILDNAGSGHFWPSGASQDRRAWVEVEAYKGGGTPFYSSGNVAAGTPVGSDPTDKDLWLLRDQMFDSSDKPVDMFWQGACAAGNELPQIVPPADSNPTNFYTHRERIYPNTTNPGDSVLSQMPDRVTLTVHLQPIGLDVLNDLVSTHDLDPTVAAQIPTLTVALPNQEADGGEATSLEWTAAAAMPGTDTLAGGVPMSCVSTLNFNVGAGAPRAADPPTSCPGSASTGDAGP